MKCLICETPISMEKKNLTFIMEITKEGVKVIGICDNAVCWHRLGIRVRDIPDSEDDN